MSENARDHELVKTEKRDFSYNIGNSCLKLTTIYPVDPRDRRGIVVPMVPGVAAARRVYEPTGEVLAERGMTAVLMRHDGAGEDGIDQVQYALELIADDDMGGVIKETDEIMPTGHSLGTRKVVRSLERMTISGRDMRIRNALFSAAACMGGVHGWNAPLRTARSIAAEVRYMGTIHALRQRHVAVEGLEYVLARAGKPLLSELYYAMHDNVSEGIRTLQSRGMQLAAIEHPDDLLVDNLVNRRVFSRLGIPVVPVRARYAGHNVQLYHPQETADAIESVLHSFKQQGSHYAA